MTKPQEQRQLGSGIQQRFVVVGGVKLDLPVRKEKPRAVNPLDDRS